MSKPLSDHMPDDLVAWLAGGRVVIVATVGDDGWPYTMIMNWAVATGLRTVRLGLNSDTQTLRNVRANGRVMLEVLGDGLVYGVRGTASVICEPMKHAPVPSAIVEVHVKAVKRDLIPGVEFQGPRFRWGKLEPVMGPLDPLGIEELRSFGAGDAAPS